MAKIVRESRPTALFWVLSAFFLLVFLTGGASRSDVASLPILRPIALIICGIGLCTLRREHLRERKWVFIFLGVICTLVALYSVPYPPVIWQNMQGDQMVDLIDKTLGFRGLWRPIAVSPNEGWNALFSLAVPSAVVVVGVQLKRTDLHRLLLVIIFLGALSAIIGVLQIISPPDSALYFYRITNNGSAVGLFSNRNHSAVFLACLFPVLATYASSGWGAHANQARRQSIAAAIAIIFVPLLLVTGSRSGLLASLLGLLGAALIYSNRDKSQKIKMVEGNAMLRYLFAGATTLSLVLVTYFMSRAEALERLLYEPQNVSLRQDFWIASLAILRDFFPWGSGPGSFANVYLIAEPIAALETTYLNHAHNDWIETTVTLGGPGFLILAVAAYSYIRRSWTIWKAGGGNSYPVRLSRMAGFGILIIALSSVTDYLLRTPIIVSLFAIFVIWFTEPLRKQS